MPLRKIHFPLLLRWLEKDHVKMAWPHKKSWTLEEIKEKYTPYVKGYKNNLESMPKPLQASLIALGSLPIGYIQAYNLYDFPRDEEIRGVPSSCAAIDMYIGEEAYLGKGIGPKALDIFIKKHIFPSFEAVYVDPDVSNERAIAAYKKAGFQQIGMSSKVLKMIRLREEREKTPFGNFKYKK